MTKLCLTLAIAILGACITDPTDVIVDEPGAEHELPADELPAADLEADEVDDGYEDAPVDIDVYCARCTSSSGGSGGGSWIWW